MSQAPILPYALDLGAALRSAPVQVEVFEELESTNAYLMALPQLHGADSPSFSPVTPSACTHARLCWALRQTAGRGRLGRNWFSDPLQSITFSLAFEYPVAAWALQPLPGELAATWNPASLSPATGWLLAQSLSQLNDGVQVKWPNDLWRNGKKIAGILIESALRGGVQRCVVGVGLNLFWQSAQHFSSGSSPLKPGGSVPNVVPPGGLFDQACSASHRVEVLATMVRSLLSLWMDPANALSGVPFARQWSRLDALADQNIELYSDGKLLTEGQNAGVASDGRLQLIVKRGAQSTLEQFSVGEISLRKRL